MSSLLPEKLLVSCAWGYGGYTAMQFINSLPNSEKLVTWSDYHGACEFTLGKCYTSNRIPHGEIDYFILTRRGRINYFFSNDKTGAKNYYKRTDPAFELHIGNRNKNFVKVFKNSDKP